MKKVCQKRESALDPLKCRLPFQANFIQNRENAISPSSDGVGRVTGYFPTYNPGWNGFGDGFRPLEHHFVSEIDRFWYFWMLFHGYSRRINQLPGSCHPSQKSSKSINQLYLRAQEELGGFMVVLQCRTQVVERLRVVLKR